MATDPAGTTLISRTLRSTPSKIIKSSNSEQNVEFPPASVRKISRLSECASHPAVAKSLVPNSPASLGSDVSIQAKIGSTKPASDLLAKTLRKNLKRKGPLQDEEQAPSKKGRRSNPGVRVVGGKIYDSDKGLTCHQCRQKTLELTAVCKGGQTKCKRGFCSKCLINRYGEKAEEASGLPAWPCPFCRGLCNCSYCRKKTGLQATGILAHVAKAQGFTSVAALLRRSPTADQPPISTNILKQTSPNSPAVGTALQASTKSTPHSAAQVKDFGQSDEKHRSKNRTPGGVKKKGNNKRKSSKPSPAALPEGTFVCPPLHEDLDGRPDPVTPPTKRLKAPGPGLTPVARLKEGEAFKTKDPENEEQGAVAAKVVEKKRQKRKSKDSKEDAQPLPRPSSCPLTILHGVAVPPQLVGDVLQTLGFLSTFADVIGLPCLSEGKLLKELLEMDKLPWGIRSTIGQVQSRLLSLLLNETGQDVPPCSRWLTALHEYLNSHPLMHRLLEHPRVVPGPARESPKPFSAKRIRAEAVQDSGSPQSATQNGEAQGESEQMERKAAFSTDLPVVNGTKEAVRILDALADGKASGGYALLSPADRVFLLKLLCDDALEMAPVRAQMEGSLAAAEEEARLLRKGNATAKDNVKEARAKLRQLELTQLLGLKGERTPMSPSAEQQLMAAISEHAAKLTDALAAAKSKPHAEKCPEAVECPAMRVLPLGAADDSVHYWKLSAASDSLLTQVYVPWKVQGESWLESSIAEVEAYADTLRTSSSHGKRLETVLRAAFPSKGGQGV